MPLQRLCYVQRVRNGQVPEQNKNEHKSINNHLPPPLLLCRRLRQHGPSLLYCYCIIRKVLVRDDEIQPARSRLVSRRRSHHFRTRYHRRGVRASFVVVVAATYGRGRPIIKRMISVTSEWVSFPTDATANYRPGRLPSALVLVIVAFSSSFQCPITLELSCGDSYLLCQQKERRRRRFIRPHYGSWQSSNVGEAKLLVDSCAATVSARRRDEKITMSMTTTLIYTLISRSR
jgi:hypothetical protein